MAVYTIWFEHPDGPYSGIISAESDQQIHEVYDGDPFFIGIQYPGEEPPPVVAEYYADQARRRPDLTEMTPAQRDYADDMGYDLDDYSDWTDSSWPPGIQVEPEERL
jgi:hypothetical protein